MNKQKEEYQDPWATEKDPDEGKSLKDMLREKREQNEKIVETKSVVATGPSAESVEERRKRLKEQRDLLLKMKNDKREKELDTFNQKTQNKDDLHKELMEMDKKVKAKQQFKQGQSSYSQVMDNFGEEEGSNTSDSPEVDKRLAMFKKMRQDLLQEESKNKQDSQNQKMSDLNKKIEELEKAKKEKALK